MTVKRISTFSPALTRTLAIIILAGLLPGVKANCWFDSGGNEHCDNLSTAARIAIGAGLFLLLLALIFSMTTYRRRRAAQANLAYIQQNQQGGGNAFSGYGGQPAYAPQYPPQTYGGPQYIAGYTPPATSPPQYYPPPPGAPPVEHQKGSYHV